jgi:hypothetical protein
MVMVKKTGYICFAISFRQLLQIKHTYIVFHRRRRKKRPTGLLSPIYSVSVIYVTRLIQQSSSLMSLQQCHNKRQSLKLIIFHYIYIVIVSFQNLSCINK